MRASVLVIMSVPSCVAVGRNALSPARPTPTFAVPTRHGERPRPLVEGEISGVRDGTLVTVHIRTPEGREARTVTRRSSGPWIAVVTEASGRDYIVTAEAGGYVSQPTSYTIHISGETAYVVRDGEVTEEEAVNLDFHFVPRD